MKPAQWPGKLIPNTRKIAGVLSDTALGVADRMAVVRNLSGISQQGNAGGWKPNATLVI